jgi:CMP-N-acetylneuraminic acid synthetase
MFEVLAVIPARGGSRGIPKKNLATVAGRSLVAMAVEAALGAEVVTRVLGSTDDAEIAGALEAAGAEVPWLRPAELARDDTPDSPVFLHVLEQLEAEDYRPDIVVNVRPTAPLRTGRHIDEAVRTLVDHPDCASVKSVCSVREHPYKMWTLAGDGGLEPVRGDWHATHRDVDAPRQSLPSVYRSNGAVDAVWAAKLLDSRAFHPGRIAAYCMTETASVDVDTVDDLAAAEATLVKGER